MHIYLRLDLHGQVESRNNCIGQKELISYTEHLTDTIHFAESIYI